MSSHLREQSSLLRELVKQGSSLKPSSRIADLDVSTTPPALPDTFVAQKEVTYRGVGLRPVTPRIQVKRSGVARLTPEEKCEKLLEDARVVARKGDVQWFVFTRSKSLYRLGLTPEQYALLKSVFAEEARLEQGHSGALSNRTRPR